MSTPLSGVTPPVASTLIPAGTVKRPPSSDFIQLANGGEIRGDEFLKMPAEARKTEIDKAAVEIDRLKDVQAKRLGLHDTSSSFAKRNLINKPSRFLFRTQTGRVLLASVIAIPVWEGLKAVLVGGAHLLGFGSKTPKPGVESLPPQALQGSDI